MSDELHPDHELASAYLDGELDAAERARVQTSPELMALVERHRRVQQAMAAVPSAPVAAREAALAAALAEFGAAPPVAPVVVPMRHRRTMAILGAAAAVLLVGVVAIAALNGGDNSDQNTATPLAEVTQQETMDASAGGGAPADTAAGEVFTSSTISAIPGAATAAPQLNEESELLALAAQMEGTASPVATAAPTSEAAGGTDVTEDAAGYRSADAFGCPLDANQVYLTQVIWRGTLAAVVRNVDTGEVVALDQSCAVLISVTP